MTAMLSFLSNNWSLALAVTLVVIAAGFTSYLLKNIWIAIAAALLLGGYYYGQHEWMAGFNDKANRDAKEQVKVLTDRMQALKEVDDLYEKQSNEDSSRIAELEKQAEQTPPNGGPCLDLDAASRVRGIH